MSVEPYSYALWRVVPRLDRGEQVNVGLVLYSRRHRFLDALTHVAPERLALLGDVDVEAVSANLAMRVAVAHGDAAAGGAVAHMDASDRFGFLVAPASTIVQPSQVHTGLTDDPQACLERLFTDLVR